MSSPLHSKKSSRSASVEFWVAKVPEFVLQEWQKRASGKPNEPVTNLLLPEDFSPRNLPKRMKLCTPGSSSVSDLEFIVRPDYLPDSKIDPPTMLVLSEQSTPSHCALEGKISLFADVRPGVGAAASYQELVDKRRSRYESDLQTQKIMLDEGKSEVTTQFKLLSGIPTSSTGRAARPVVLRRADRAVDKRVRLDESKLKRKLFHLFDDKPHYRLSELVQLTDQPKAYLKEVLDQICIQHRTGPMMHHYSLKPNYRLTTDTEETQAV